MRLKPKMCKHSPRLCMQRHAKSVSRAISVSSVPTYSH